MTVFPLILSDLADFVRREYVLGLKYRISHPFVFRHVLPETSGDWS